MKTEIVRSVPHGVWPVMLTPFHGRNKVDWTQLENLVEWYISQGVHGLFTTCLSSEAFEMTNSVKVLLAGKVAEIVNGRIPVIAGAIGTSSLPERVELSKALVSAGCSAVILSTSELVSQEDTDEAWISAMEQHLADLNDLPLGLYECPIPHRRPLTSALTAYVAGTKRFLFIKETSANLGEQTRKAAAGLPIFSAHAPSLAKAIEHGVVGYSGLQANLWPGLLVKFFQVTQTSPATLDLISDFITEYNWVTTRSYPASAKSFLNLTYGLNLPTLSFLNQSKVDPEDLEWLQEVSGKLLGFLENMPEN